MQREPTGLSRESGAPLLLGPRATRLLKALHLAGVVVLIGALLAVLAVVVLKTEFSVDDDLFLLDLAAFRLYAQAATWGFVAVIATGATYAAFTDTGLLRWRWVTIKWLASFGLVGAAIAWITPAVTGMVALGDVFRQEDLADYLHATALAGVSVMGALMLLALLVALSVFKPWGMHRRPWGPPGIAFRLLVVAAVAGAGAALYGYGAYLDEVRSEAVDDIDASELADGVYRGEAICGGGSYHVSVEVESGEMRDIRILDPRDDFYSRLGERIVQRILAEQTPAVDAVTGATVTSKCIQRAVERALSPPGGTSAGRNRPGIHSTGLVR